MDNPLRLYIVTDTLRKGKVSFMSIIRGKEELAIRITYPKDGHSDRETLIDNLPALRRLLRSRWNRESI